ncbi:nicotinate-nucleotide--dimethylbenzimidazole phosphoribosyltransferase [Halalkalicoccus sp. NIPERK01]|uniref:nicotinate-nucleotide--dimethylbenzimidazole phosphoribosyltransferase n=1 Tax=Halalkalicoccus sp. NIPERK01 TaxID=3053469 RepID=UPI00256E9F72|nr:TIGR00303 family protein [Halalkalicoccus sp. NIPERK01]
MTRLAVVCGTTHTAGIEGISAAGASPDLMARTPAADAEILVYGRPAGSITPVSPTGCPTPAIVTRAARERLGFDPLIVDAGMAAATAAPTVSVGDRPGGDVREGAAVPNARRVFERAREFGSRLPDEELWIGETIPGGTTTAMAVLRALGEDWGVSSSLPDNPVALKRRVVREGLAASGLDGGTSDPLAAIEAVGDPVLAGVVGLVAGTVGTDARVTLAGGTQLLAAAACVRGLGIDAPLALATTSFVAHDTPAIRERARALECSLTVTDPRFSETHVAMERYLAGEAKEGVGMGGALALFAREGGEWERLHDRIEAVYDRCA